MELVTLNSQFHEQDLVENYESLIWSERYSNAGDFELKSGDISGTLARLPRGTVVSLRESSVPMVVELHKIEKKKGSGPKLTVVGRSFDIYALELRASVRRALPATTAMVPWTITANKESDAAYKAMRLVIGDIARTQGGVEVLSAVAPAVSPLDAIPEVTLTLPADYSTGTTNTYEIKADNLYTTVMDLITTNNRGLKSVRPSASSNQIAIEIYNGADLTNELVFDARFDQFDDTTYLLSEQGSKNVAYVYGPNGGERVLKTTSPEPSGLNRRVLVLDLISDSTASSTAIRNTRGLTELYKYNATALFDGQTAEQIALGYNNTYFLGDILKLTGEYNLSQNVRVAEFIRTSDNTGSKAYPTFQAVD